MTTNKFLDKYIDGVLAKAEGTKAHVGKQDKIATLAYGLTAAATSAIPRKAKESDKEYAKRVLEQKYLPEVKNKLGKSWDKMPESMKIVALDTHFNAGLNTAPSFVKNLKDGDYKEALEDTLDIVSVTDTKTKKEYTSPGLANRRAAVYNLAAKDLNLPTITDTLVSKNGTVSYFTGEGRDVLFSKDIGKPIYPTSKVEFRAPAEFSFQREPVKPKVQQTKGILSQANAATGLKFGNVEGLEPSFSTEQWKPEVPGDEIRGDTVDPEWAAYFDAIKAGDVGAPSKVARTAAITEPIEVIPNVKRQDVAEVVVEPEPTYRDNEIRPKSFMGEPVAPQNIWRDSSGNPILDRFGGYIYQKQY